jgi:hypothetical protein
MSFGVNINFKKKYMKNIISKIFIAFMALFMMVGCSQDFLMIQNQQMLFPGCSFTSRTGTEAYLGIMRRFGAIYSY